MYKSFFNSICFLLLIFNVSFAVSAKEKIEEKNQIEQNELQKKSFDVGNFIFDHIADHYSWHIFTYKHNHVAIPLPVILYSTSKGWNIFLSSKLNHNPIYKGFKIDSEGKYKGKIVEVDSEGTFIERPFDISITKNVAALLISCSILIIVFVSVAKTYKRRVDLPPKGLQSILEIVIIFVRDDISKSSLGEKNSTKYTPYLLTIFFFVLLNNLMGLIPIFPGGANITGNITITMVLSLFTFIITTVTGNKNYWKHIFNAPAVPWWLKAPLPLIPLIEMTGLFIKPFVLMVRLFANISAGHIIALGFFSLIFIFGNMNTYAGFLVSPLSVMFTIFMSMLELLVAFIQAYVFTFLSALYFSMAIEEHH